jgi:hypothetical protein
MGLKKIPPHDPEKLKELLKLPRHLRTFCAFMPDTKEVPHRIAKEVFYNTSTGDSYPLPDKQVRFKFYVLNVDFDFESSFIIESCEKSSSVFNVVQDLLHRPWRMERKKSGIPSWPQRLPKVHFKLFS